ncbi:short-chain dehydrogenase TIC 32, chloroplastic-like [Mercurialis annua]|uniref:short-chain dehydrogenase TIC 32, chloroplastic-like n=1 Tax=Mercurialis annua TaxID=3986 RepID=UPI002160FF0D|nr:short-chain dehydrogenase TIC 32, chloroplastic-like [Mercurialis annua]
MEMKEVGDALRFMWSTEFLRMSVYWTVSLIISYLRLFYQRMIFGHSCNSYPRCSPPRNGHAAPVCIVTGATSGLGAAAAYALSREGFFVVLAGRSSRLLCETAERIKKQNRDAQVKALEVDLSSFQSILKFKDSLEKWLLDSDMHSSIQLLVNNAGILATSHRLTSEGYDWMMSTNYMGPFSLTQLLLPLLQNSPVGSRIVNVSSFTHRSVFDMQVNIDSVSGKGFWTSGQYPFASIYEYSKLCVLLLSYQLHRQLYLMDESCRISVNAADPGVVETNIMRELPSSLSGLAFTVLKFLGLLQSPEDGVNSILDAALAPPERSGLYFFGGKGRTLNSSALSRDISLAGKLWTTSFDMFQELKLVSKGKKIDIFHDPE